VGTAVRGYEEVLPLIAIVVGGILIPTLPQHPAQKEMTVLPRVGQNRVVTSDFGAPRLWGTPAVQ
jgi:hypothetical protein